MRGIRRSVLTCDPTETDSSKRLETDYSKLFGSYEEHLRYQEHEERVRKKLDTMPSVEEIEKLIPDTITFPELSVTTAEQNRKELSNPIVKNVRISPENTFGNNKHVSWEETVKLSDGKCKPLEAFTRTVLTKPRRSSTCGIVKLRKKRTSIGASTNASSRVPAIRGNVYYLLARQGNRCKDLWCAKARISDWSSVEMWFLVGVYSDGFPWSVCTKDNCESILIRCRSLERFPSTLIERKREDIISSSSVHTFLSKEWNEYVSHRFQTLHSLGRFALQDYLQIYPESNGNTRGKSHQSLVWHKNSCALDSVIHIVPHLALKVTRTGLFRKDILSKNGCFHSPAATLLVALRALREPQSNVLLHSNWARHLMIDIVQMGVQKYGNRPGMGTWSGFSRHNDYLCIADTLWNIQYLFGVGCERFESGDLPNFFEIPPHVQRVVFTGIKSQLVGDKTTMASFLYHCVGEFQDEIVSGLFFLPITDVSSLYKDWLTSKFKTSWKGRYQCLESSTVWNVELLACVGPTGQQSEHFAAATFHFKPTQHVEFHDGMKHSGVAQVYTVEEVFSNEGKFYLPGSILIFVVDSVNK